MKTIKKIPAIRFSGFTEEWEERKAKEMIKTHHFRSYLAEPNDVGNYEVIQQGDKPIAGYANGEPFEYFYDVTLFGDHTVSLFKPTKPFFIANDGVKIISADEFDGRYFYVTLERYKPASQGYKRHFTILKNEDIWFTTNKDEQVKIGTFFKQLDDTIALHQRKLDFLKEQKKGYLQKMFPKNGAKVPELRFAGFADDWEERKLSDISNVTKLAGFEFTKYVRYQESGKIIALRGLNVKNGELVLDEVKYIDDSDFSKLNRSKLYKNDILLTYVGTVGELAIVPENDKYYLAPNVARIRLQEHVNSIFVCQMMNDSNFYNRIISPLIATSSQPALSMENVRKFQLLMPDYQEQEKIGSFFKQLDDTIALHQRKLDLLKEQK
ncbi:restriction endonuclease subunit S, partial [Weissella confusa]|uniref:restriction endonuclease subunit S n=1 Tax=Weissella confusa TaxID=1583 RepID=UPI0021AF0D18